MLSAAAVFGLATAGYAEEMAYAKKPGNPFDANAADLSFKAKAPAKAEDDSLCWHGICLYGQIDYGLTYQSHGAPLNNLAGSPVLYLISSRGQGPYFGVGANQLSSSFVGLRGKQEIADGLFAIFNLQSQFNPESGLLSNGLGSVAQNNGLPNARQNAFGDSSKNGQAFNSAAYAGLSSPVYGTLTYGRQNALTSDGVINYDPLASSGAFSVIGFQGLTGGAGDTLLRIYDNSFKYTVAVGPLRFAAEAALRSGQFSGGQGNNFEAEIGFDYAGFSFDAIGAKVEDAISSAPLTAAQLTTANATPVGQGLGLVSGTVSDNTAFMLLAKYTIGPVKLFAGYEHIDFNNPNNPLSIGSFLPGGYVLGAVNNTAFTSTRTFQTFWTGAKWAVRSDLDLTLAYYHEEQNSFIAGTAAAPINVVGCSNASLAQCSGQLNAVSFVADWRFAKHFDAYAGVLWSQAANGLASGFLSLKPGSNVTANWSPSIGLKYSF
jgi:predicted porin